MVCAAVQSLGWHRPQLRLQTPRPQTPYPKLPDSSPQTGCFWANEPLTNHSHGTHKPLKPLPPPPLLSHPSLCPNRTHLRATHEPLPSSSLLPKASVLLTSYGPRPVMAPLHTLSVCGLCSLAAPSHKRHQISPSCNVERCLKNMPKDSRRIKSLTSYFTASSANAWVHPFCFRPH